MAKEVTCTINTVLEDIEHMWGKIFCNSVKARKRGRETGNCNTCNWDRAFFHNKLVTSDTSDNAVAFVSF